MHDDSDDLKNESAVYSLMVGSQDASSWHAVDVWRNLHKSLQKFATVLHQRCVIALQLLCSYLRGVGRQTYLLVVHKKLSAWGEKKQEKTLFYFSARWNLQWQVNVVGFFFFDKFRRYRSLKITKKKSLQKKSGSAVSRWALLRHKSMKGKPLMNVRYGVFSQLKTIVLKSFSQLCDSRWGEWSLCYSHSAPCWPGVRHLHSTSSLALVIHSAECTVPAECCSPTGSQRITKMILKPSFKAEEPHGAALMVRVTFAFFSLKLKNKTPKDSLSSS